MGKWATGLANNRKTNITIWGVTRIVFNFGYIDDDLHATIKTLTKVNRTVPNIYGNKTLILLARVKGMKVYEEKIASV